MKFRFDDKRNNQVTAFNSLLPDIIDDLDIKESFFITTIKEKWESYVGRTMSVHSTPDRIFNRTLFVSVDHSVYANDLSLHSGKILVKIRDEFGSDFISKIRFEVSRKSRFRK